jgi:23S rRNA (cytosine1962-C5)-methyltransferase
VVDVEVDGDRVGAGYFDPGSAIRARVLSQVSQVDIDAAWLAARVAAALALRRIDVDGQRLIHGENDFLPGLVVDRYGPVAAVSYDGAGAAALWGRFEPGLFAAIRAARPVAALFARGRGVIAGAAELDGLTIAEGDARFEVDLERGHKTGLFLDQRPNRERVAGLANGSAVLNLFGYTGGFSIHAHLGGARRVVTVEQAAPALAAARRNIEASGLDLAAHELVCGDVFEYLRRSSERFDVVVCDPPSFAPSRKAVARAERAYRSLNQLAAGAVAPGGVLVTASCSSHIDRDRFDQLVAEGLAAAGRRAVVFERGGAGPDHPSRVGFPEGDYLQVSYLALD